MGLSSFFNNLFGSTKNSAANLSSETESTNKVITSPSGAQPETFVEETFEKVKESSEPILESVVEYAHMAKDIISDYVEKATDSINDIIDAVKETTSELTDDEKSIVSDRVVDSSEEPITDKE